MSWLIAREFRFEAAHRLPLHEGKCASMHGHSYRVVIVLSSGSLHEEGSQCGMVLDFGFVKEAMRPLLRVLDHQLLNDLPGLENPTAENLARWIAEHLNLAELESVRVWETGTSWAEFQKPRPS